MYALKELFKCNYEYKVEDKIIQRLEKYKYYNFLAYVYIFSYDNDIESIREIAAGRKEAYYFEKGTVFWVAIDDNDRVIGSVVYSKAEKEDEAFIHRLFIKPTLKHKGIDTALLKTAEKEMKNKGIKVSMVHLGEPKEQWFE